MLGDTFDSHPDICGDEQKSSIQGAANAIISFNLIIFQIEFREQRTTRSHGGKLVAFPVIGD